MTARCHVSLSFLLTIALLLTHAPGPSAAPPVNRIAYIDRTGDLYTIRPDGTGRQKMASGEMLQQASFVPRLSPAQSGLLQLASLVARRTALGQLSR